MTPNPDASCAILTQALRDRPPFFFVRIGDGAIECITNPEKGHTCDGEKYSKDLGEAVFESIVALGDSDQVLWGDWQTAVAGSVPNHIAAWKRVIRPVRKQMLNYEALLLMRRSHELLDFYRTLARDPRKVVYVGRNAEPAARMLHAHFIETPMGMTLDSSDFLAMELDRANPDVVLFGAGMAGLVRVVDYWLGHPNVTCIHLGSALDPLAGKPTRSRQLSTADARDFLKELL